MTPPDASPRRSLLFNRRVQMLVLLSISSGMPLGIVLSLFQFFLRRSGVDLRTIGILSAVSLPWTFKFLWSPLVDRYAFRWPGRRRSWVVLAQLALAALLAALAWAAERYRYVDTSGAHLWPGAIPMLAALAFGIAFASATQDIALDAYAVEVIHRDEAGPVSGFRIMYYRVGYWFVQAVALALTAVIGWAAVFAMLAGLFLLFIGLTFFATASRQSLPPRSLREAVVEPFRSFLKRRTWWVLALFVLFYKFGDNFAGTMVNPFLTDICLSNVEIAFAAKTMGLIGTLGGTALGALLMTRLGLGRALWLFGVFQALGNGLYALAATTRAGPLAENLCKASLVLSPLSLHTKVSVYVAICGEYAFQGMGTAALAALLLRASERRFSATQYALLSGIMGFGRTISGLPSGFIAQKLGYPTFFVLAVLAAVPGFILLQRIAPIQGRDIDSSVEPSLEPEATPAAA